MVRVKELRKKINFLVLLLALEMEKTNKQTNKFLIGKVTRTKNTSLAHYVSDTINTDHAVNNAL